MKKITLFAAIIYLSMISSYSQWVQLPGPKGTHVNAIKGSNNIYYAATRSKGIFRSSNNGATWQAVNNGLGADCEVKDVLIYGNYVFAAVSSSCPGTINVYRSSNNGNNWAVSGTGIPNKITESFAVKGNTIWAAVFELPNHSGIYRSNDTGNTWTQINSIIEVPNQIFANSTAIIVSEDNFIWQSLDDGASWDVTEQFALSGVWSFTQSGNRIIGAGITGIYFSTDNGSTWDYTNMSGGASSLSSFGNTVFLGGQNVLKSTNSGVTWVSSSSGLGIGTIDALFFDGTHVFAGTTGDTAGIYKSTNTGTSWFSSAAGLSPASTIRSLVSLGDIVFAGMQSDGVYRSTDDGNSWFKVGLNNDSLKTQLVFSLCTKNTLLFAGTGNGFYSSTDNGTTFTRKVNGFPSGGSINVYSLTVSGNNIIAAVTIAYSTSSIDGIWYSTNNGDLWIQSSLPIEPIFVSAVACDGSSAVYAGIYGQSFSVTGLYKLTNGGVNFISMTSSLMVDIERLAVSGSNVLAGGLFFSHYSTDAGFSWGSYFIPCGGTFAYTLRNNHIFAGNCEGMYHSTNLGVNWSDANTGFPACPLPDVESSCSNPNYLFA